MLAINAYPPEYIDRCRTSMERQIAVFRDLASGRQPHERDAFEAEFASNMVLLLEQMFVHRSRENEGGHGTVLDEVRSLADSILRHDGRFETEGPSAGDQGVGVLGHRPGDRVHLDIDDLDRLSRAYFAEIERRFSVA